MRRRYGTGSLWLRGRTWWIRYHVQGKLVAESAKTGSRREAEALLRERLAGVDRGVVTPATSRVTLADLERLVAEDYKVNGRRSARNLPGTFAHLRDGFGADRLARDITSGAWEAYKARRLDEGAQPSTVNRELAMLRRGFRLAVRHGQLGARPDLVALRENNVRKGFFDEEQLATLLAHLPAWLAPVARFMYWTGWRKGEAVALEWRNVDRGRRVASIETSKNDEPRTLPYGALPEIVAVVDEQWRLHEELKARGQVCPFVFPTPRCRRIRDVWRVWRAACAEAGLPGRLMHDFRRSAVRNLERAGVPRSVAMKITGHKTESIYKRYAIVTEKDVEDGLRKLAAAAGVRS